MGKTILKQGLTAKKFLLFNCLICFLLLFSSVNTDDSDATLFQVIWYESTSNYKTDTIGLLSNQDYHIINMIISSSNSIFNSLPANYIALIQRSNSSSNVDTQLFKDNNSDSYSMFTFFLLNLNGNHFKNRKYVIWNVACNNSTGVVTYNIKFFTCETDLDTFYLNLTANIKVKNYGNSLDVANISVTNGFSSTQIYNILTTNTCKP